MARTDLTIPELGDKFVDYREQIWGDSFVWCWERRADEVEYLVIHHSVTSHEATPDEIALLHKNRGWGGIGYHFVITKDGKTWYVGDVSTARANVADMNEKVIGICMVGDFTKHLPSDEQIVSAHRLCKFFLGQPQWPNVNDWKENVVGHKELQATQCPGTSWDKSQDGDMWWRVKTGTKYSMNGGGENELSCEDKLTKAEIKIGSLTDEVVNARLEADELRTALKAEETDHGDTRKELEEIRKQRDQAIRERQEAENAAKEFKDQVFSMEARLSSLYDDITALKTQLRVSQVEILKKLSFFQLLKLYFGKGGD